VSAKRIIQAGDLAPGDSFSLVARGGGPIRWRMPIMQVDAVRDDGDLRCWNEAGDLVRIRPSSDTLPVSVGWTSRKAKRQRGKMQRRSRFEVNS